MIAIRAFDPHAASAAEWSAYQRLRRARAEEDDPGETLPSDDDFKNELRRHRPLFESRRFVAMAGDAVAGMIGVGFRRQGTADYADYAPYCDAWGGVLLPWRRQGVGSALLRPLVDFMTERGKARVTIDARGPEAHAFLTAVGAEARHVMLRNRLDLGGLDLAVAAGWEAAVPAGLAWEIHAGQVPMGRLEALLPQFTRLFADVPLGSLDVPALRYELPAYRAWYGELDRHGGEHLLVLLLAGDQVAALCEGAFDARYPDRVHQLLTAVARHWRGQGLARAVKAAMLRLVRQRHPAATRMFTLNAEGNAPILALNRRLGFVQDRRSASYQIEREALAGWLAGRKAG